MFNMVTNPARSLGQSRHAVTSRLAVTVRRPVVSVHASGSQAEGERPAADKVALSALLAAAMLVTSGPALAATYKPNTVYNNTDFVVEAHFNYKQDASCTTPTDVGKIQPGFMLTFPRGRGSCAVNEMTAVAFNQSGTSKSPVATVRWKPSDPNSQSFSKWAVLQMKNQTPSIQVVHIMD